MFSRKELLWISHEVLRALASTHPLNLCLHFFDETNRQLRCATATILIPLSNSSSSYPFSNTDITSLILSYLRISSARPSHLLDIFKTWGQESVQNWNVQSKYIPSYTQAGYDSDARALMYALMYHYARATMNSLGNHTANYDGSRWFFRVYVRPWSWNPRTRRAFCILKIRCVNWSVPYLKT
jgi:hypothetical protein